MAIGSRQGQLRLGASVVLALLIVVGTYLADPCRAEVHAQEQSPSGWLTVVQRAVNTSISDGVPPVARAAGAGAAASGPGSAELPGSSLAATGRSVSARAASALPAASPHQVSWSTLIGIAGTALLPLFAWLAITARRRRALPAAASAAAIAQAPAAPTSPSSSSLPDNMLPLARLMLVAVEHLTEARASLGRLPPDLPLRHVLARELSVSGRVLDGLVAQVAPGASAEGAEPAAAGVEAGERLEERMQAVIAELRRLADIAASAGASVAGSGRPEASSPEVRDKAGAYRVLGVNPDASEAIVKKLVDALRQSWHPDLARDDEDRHHREERLKEINVAWDLIRGKRAQT